MASFLKTVRGQNTEELAEGNSVVHRMHPMTKILATGLFIVFVVSFDRYQVTALFPFFFYPFFMMCLSETPWAAVFYRMLPALPFSVFGGISNIYFDREIAFFIGSLAVSFGMVSFVSILL